MRARPPAFWQRWRRARPGPNIGDTVIIPGFGLMDGDFTAYVDGVKRGEFHTSMGILSGWHPVEDYVHCGERWVHETLVEEYTET